MADEKRVEDVDKRRSVLEHVAKKWRVYRYEREPDAVAVPIELLIHAVTSTTHDYEVMLDCLFDRRLQAFARELSLAVTAFETLAYSTEKLEVNQVHALEFVDWGYVMFVRPRSICIGGCGSVSSYETCSKCKNFGTCAECAKTHVPGSETCRLTAEEMSVVRRRLHRVDGLCCHCLHTFRVSTSPPPPCCDACTERSSMCNN